MSGPAFDGRRDACRHALGRGVGLAVAALLLAGGPALTLENRALERPVFADGSDAERLGLAGPVLGVRTKVRFVLGNVVEVRFDESGRRTMRQRTAANGSVAEQQRWTYDERGDLVEELDSRWDEEAGLSGPIGKSEYRYGEPGPVRTCERIDYDGEGSEVARCAYELSTDPESGRTLRRSESWRFPDGTERVAQETYEYDQAGRLTRVTTVQRTGEDQASSIMEIGYDGDGNRIEETTRAPGAGVTSRVGFVYEGGVRVEQLRFDPPDSDVVRERFRFDERGQEIQWFEYAPDGTVLRSRQADVGYDDHGNWIRRIERYHDDTPPTMTFRIIDYHDGGAGESGASGSPR